MASSDQKFVLGRGDEPDRFVVDIERLSHDTDKDFSPNSRISQHDTFVLDTHRFSINTDGDNSPNSRISRSFSRKGSYRGERTSNTTTAASNDKATDIAAANGDMSSKGGSCGGSLAEKSIKVPTGTAAVEAINKQKQVVMMMMNSESRCSSGSNTPRRRQGGKRPLAWLVSPRMVLAFFATLSSMGTILLIYFTLSIHKLGEEDLSQALPQ